MAFGGQALPEFLKNVKDKGGKPQAVAPTKGGKQMPFPPKKGNLPIKKGK